MSLGQGSQLLDRGYLIEGDFDIGELGKRIEIARYEKAIQAGFREVANGHAARSGLADRIEASTASVKAQQKRFELADSR